MQEVEESYSLHDFQQHIASYPSLHPGRVVEKLLAENQRTTAEFPAIDMEALACLAHPMSVAGEGDAIPLPPPLLADTSLYEALHKRSSTRFYDPSLSIDARQLSTILAAASEGDRQDWQQEIQAGIDIQFFVVAWQVEKIPPAIYKYEATTNALHFVNSAPDQQKDGINLVLQTEFAQAPFIILITGNLAVACARCGAWGHRQLLLRAGSAGQRMWFASLGVGLVGTVFAGFLPDAARAFLGVDGYTRASLFAYSAGHPLLA